MPMVAARVTWRERRMADSIGQMADGRWRMADGGWRMAHSMILAVA
jgi:hypothetical protein